MSDEIENRCPEFYLLPSGMGQCHIYPVCGGFEAWKCDLDVPETCGDGCPGDKGSEHVVVTNVPQGVTRGVSWSEVSRHSTWYEAVKEAQRLTSEANYDDERGRSMWSGQGYRVIHWAYADDCAAGSTDPPDLFEWPEETEEDEE